MSVKSSTSDFPISEFWTSAVSLSWLQKACLMCAGTALLALSAKISIPMWPVNATLHTFTVIAIGAVYGRKLGAATIALYLFEGAMGLPVFTGTPERGIGLVYMAGPTAGFMLGWLPAAYISGALVERGWGKNMWGALAVFVCGAVALYIPGMIWLSYLVGLNVAFHNLLGWVPAFFVQEFLGAAALPMVTPLLQRTKK